MGVQDLLDDARKAYDEGEETEAITLARSAIDVAQKAGDKAEEAMVWMVMADELGGSGDAVVFCKKAMQLFQALGDKSREASAMISCGYHDIDACQYEEAIREGKAASEIYKSLKDAQGGMMAVKLQADAYVASGEADEALRLAQDRRVVCNAAGDLEGEVTCIQMILDAKLANKDMDGVLSTAMKSIDFFEAIDSPMGAGQMWLQVAKCKLAKPLEKGNMEFAADAAQKAQKMFSELEMYDLENEAIQVYQQAEAIQKNAQYMIVEKEAMYKIVRMGGIQYGPQYRANNIISGRTRTGPNPHTTCSLMLHGNYDPGWEEDVHHHPALIDAGARSGFSNQLTRPMTAEEFEMLKRAGQADAQGIPYMMDKGVFNQRRQRNNEPMWMSIYVEPSKDGPKGQVNFWQDK